MSSLKRYYDKKNDRIIFAEENINTAFWDKKWISENLEEVVKTNCNNNYVLEFTNKFLGKNKNFKVLEGGCGNGHFVYSLNKNGYIVYGIDNAKETVKKINHLFQGLKISVGDVEKIDFPDNFFDGYWSIGVIEHFFDGYSQILKEMRRVIKKEGYLFLVFPHINFFRKLKIKLGLYEKFNKDSFNKKDFYQFVLNYKKVVNDLENLGFDLVFEKKREGLLGIKKEVPFLRLFLEKENIFSKFFRFFIRRLSSPFSSHTILLVFKNNK